MKTLIMLLLPLSSLAQQLYTTAGATYHIGHQLPAAAVQVGYESKRQTTVSVANYNYGQKAPFVFAGLIGYQVRDCNDEPRIRVEAGLGGYVENEKQQVKPLPVVQVSVSIVRWLEFQVSYANGVQVGLSWVGRIY